MDSAIAHLGEVCQATLRQSLYANWTVVVSFFFSFDVFSVSKLLTVAYATETLS